MNASDFALKRCVTLLQLAREATDEKLAKRYVSLAKKIAMRHRLHLKKDYCKKCLNPFVEGRTVKTRILNKVIEKTCLACGEKKRRPVANKTAVKSNG